MVNSLYEYLNPLSVVAKQRFADNFDGDAINERWTLEDITGTGSVSMNDAIDGGLRLSTGAGASDESALTFNNKRHYSNTGSVTIHTGKRVGTGTAGHIAGLINDATSSGIQRAVWRDSTGTSFKALITSDGSTSNTVNSSVAIDNNFSTGKIELFSASATYHILGILEATSSSNLPTVKLEPYVRAFNGTSSDIRYFEAYNT